MYTFSSCKTFVNRTKIVVCIFLIFTIFAAFLSDTNRSKEEFNGNIKNMTQIKIFTFNHFSQNTFVLHDDSKTAIIIDPGCYFDEEKDDLLKYINSNNLSVKYVVFTHCHLDHAFGAAFIHQKFPQIDFIGHKDESFFIDDAINQSLRFGIKMDQPPKLSKKLVDGDTLTFGNTNLKVIHVPGHSPGSLCYYDENQKILIAGDVLFAGSVGRSDLPGGNHDTLISEIKKKLLTLPEDVVVYPGHGPSTTIKTEKLSNPFLK